MLQLPSKFYDYTPHVMITLQMSWLSSFCHNYPLNVTPHMKKISLSEIDLEPKKMNVENDPCWPHPLPPIMKFSIIFLFFFNPSLFNQFTMRLLCLIEFKLNIKDAQWIKVFLEWITSR